MEELTEQEIKMVLDAAQKAKNGLAKPVMFFGTCGLFYPYNGNLDYTSNQVDMDNIGNFLSL